MESFLCWLSNCFYVKSSSGFHRNLLLLPSPCLSSSRATHHVRQSNLNPSPTVIKSNKYCLLVTINHWNPITLHRSHLCDEVLQLQQFLCKTKCIRTRLMQIMQCPETLEFSHTNSYMRIFIGSHTCACFFASDVNHSEQNRLNKQKKKKKTRLKSLYYISEELFEKEQK